MTTSKLLCYSVNSYFLLYLLYFSTRKKNNGLMKCQPTWQLLHTKNHLTKKLWLSLSLWQDIECQKNADWNQKIKPRYVKRTCLRKIFYFCVRTLSGYTSKNVSYEEMKQQPNIIDNIFEVHSGIFTNAPWTIIKKWNTAFLFSINRKEPYQLNYKR